MHAAVGVSHSSDLTRAIEEASAIARAGLAGDAELALTFVSTAHGRIGAGVGRVAAQALGVGRSATAHVEGLLCPEGEHTGTPVVAVLGLAGTDFEIYSFDHARGREGELGEELAATFGPLGGDDLVLVVADAHELDARPLAAGLAACAPAAVLGVGVEGPARSPSAHLVDDELVERGALAVRLRAPRALRCALAPAASLGEPRTVSRARGNWILELDGVSALEEFRDAAGALWDDERRAMRSVLMALPDAPGAEPSPALLRSIVGIDEQVGAIALAESLEPGARVAFARRDAQAAREALSAAAQPISSLGEGGGLGLAASCRARGEELFEHAGIEAGYLARAFAESPWLGLIGSYQIGATAGCPANLLTHTGALVRLV